MLTDQQANPGARGDQNLFALALAQFVAHDRAQVLSALRARMNTLREVAAATHYCWTTSAVERWALQRAQQQISMHTLHAEYSAVAAFLRYVLDEESGLRDKFLGFADVFPKPIEDVVAELYDDASPSNTNDNAADDSESEAQARNA